MAQMAEHSGYNLDIQHLAGSRPRGDTVVKGIEQTPLGLHETNLFDINERLSDGALHDEATGENYDNTTFTALDGLDLVVTAGGNEDQTDVLPALRERDDAAAQWLREHDSGGAVHELATAKGLRKRTPTHLGSLSLNGSGDMNVLAHEAAS